MANKYKLILTDDHLATLNDDPEMEGLPQEKFQEAGSEYCEYTVKPGWEKEAEEISKEIQETVQLAHERLGHPRVNILVRMLKIGGARPDAIKYAKIMQCSVCEESQTARIRRQGQSGLMA